jgi:hypothetical protein
VGIPFKRHCCNESFPNGGSSIPCEQPPPVDLPTCLGTVELALLYDRGKDRSSSLGPLSLVSERRVASSPKLRGVVI